MGINEWAVSGADDPKFAKQLISWIVKRPAGADARLLPGLRRTGNQYDLGHYPRTTNMCGRRSAAPTSSPTPNTTPALLPPLPPKPKPTKPKKPKPDPTPTPGHRSPAPNY